MFNLSPEYCTKYRLKQLRSTPGLESVSTARLNFTQLCKLFNYYSALIDSHHFPIVMIIIPASNTHIGSTIDVERSVAEKIYTSFVSAVGAGVTTGVYMSRDKQIFICTSRTPASLLGRQALLTINKVAEINFAKNEMKIKFMPAFLATLGQEIRVSVPGRASSHLPCCTTIYTPQSPL